MKKAGAAHIEVILSLVLFIGFITLAFYFFSPIDTSRTLKSSLAYAITEISNNLTTALDIYSLKINSINPPQEIIGVTLEDTSGKKLRVEDYSGNILPSYHSGNNIYFNRFQDGTYKDFIIIKFHEDFLEPQDLDPLALPSVDISQYKVSSSESREVFSEARASKLAQIYSSTEKYVFLKKDFNLPNRIDFAFSLQFSPSDEITAQIPIPQNIEVFSEIKRVEALRTSGNTAFASFKVMVW